MRVVLFAFALMILLPINHGQEILTVGARSMAAAAPIVILSRWNSVVPRYPETAASAGTMASMTAGA